MKIKDLLQKAFRSSGYELRRVVDPFALQQRLTRSAHPVILDVGAFTGGYALNYARLFPAATIHAFEPFPASYAALCTRTAGHAGIRPHQAAISDRAGRTRFHANAFAPTNSLLETDSAAAGYWGAGLLETQADLDVETATLDLFCAANEIPQVDILKLDIQGAEYLALQGAHDLLAQGRIMLIYMEMILVPTYRQQHRLHELLSYLDGFGYSLVNLYNPALQNGRLIQADLLFIAPALEPLLHEPKAGA